MLFESQTEWGEGQVSEAARFRDFAQQLGLDMAAYDAAIADPATQARIDLDFQAGIALDVNSTPGIFIDDEQLQLQTLDDIEAGIEDALLADR